MEAYEGRCLCGAVQYRIRPPTLFCAHCHCRYCRRAHGAGVVTWCGVPTDQFELTEGSDCLRWFASSNESRRGFCRVCGTTMFFRSEVAPGEMHIARACIEGDIDRRPQGHVFYDHHVVWLEVDNELPRIDSTSPQLAKYRKITS
jgi:hypothetical protein